MQIFVAKNNEQLGPFTPEEVRAKVASGEFNELDLGWHDGIPEWQLLSKILPSLQSPTIPPPIEVRKSSGIAIASFVISLLGIGIWFTLVILAVVGVMNGASEQGILMVSVGLGMFAMMGVNLVGAILGIVDLTKDISNKWMAIVGLALNALEILGIIFLMILGTLQK